mmetsp:Transcript_7702/g.23313  ORF Transcript_7702/g.23313 Transcript_7702/m.23313 type:complete len:121 (-) Transcript_7702:1023-1385(-)
MIRSLMRLRSVTLVPGTPTGFAKEEGTREKLIELYKATLEELKTLPEKSAYKRNVEKVTAYRLKVVESKDGDEQVEDKIGSGKLEELMLQANEESSLMADMKKEEPWNADAKKISIDLID